MSLVYNVFMYQCLNILVPQPITITVSSPPSQTEWRMTITGSTEPYCHSPLTRDAILAAVHTLLLSGGIANVGIIDLWVGVEVDVRQLRRNAVDQLASGYNSSQSAALLVGV